MSLKESITELITAAVTQAGYFLDDVQIISPGNHRIITCIVDSDGPLNLDQVTEVSREISALLDEAIFMGDDAFTLEVTSPGVDRPLTQPRHWTKALTRLIKATLKDGTVVNGHLKEFDEECAILVENIKGRMKTHEVLFENIKRAQVEVEFNRKDGGDL